MMIRASWQPKALVLWEPWASAMALGFKANETRSWATGYRGDLAICAAKRLMDPGDWKLVTLFNVDVTTWEPPYGCVVCVVELYDCVPVEAFESGGYFYKPHDLPQWRAVPGLNNTE